MPKKVSIFDRNRALTMMHDGVSQREISKQTGLSRPYLRKLAGEVGFQFPRNGFEIIGDICICSNCFVWFRRSSSRVQRSNKHFCSADCRKAHFTGPSHPNWKQGSSAKSFSTWVLNQGAYKDWRKQVLERDNHRCQISGRDFDLEAHHILPKAEGFSPETAFDVDNGITLNKEVHTRLHQLVSEGYSYQDCLKKLKDEFFVQEQDLQEKE